MKSRRASTRGEIRALSNAELHLGAGELTGEERGIVLGLLYYLDELDGRGDFGPHSSLWTYCLDALRLSENQAFLRINGMRLLRNYPELSGRLRDGRLNLSTLAAVRKVVRPENADTLFKEIEGKTRKQAVEIAAMAKARIVPRSSIVPVKPNVIQAPPQMTALRLAEGIPQVSSDGASGSAGLLSPEVQVGATGALVDAAKDTPVRLPEMYLVMGVEDLRDLQPVSVTQCKLTITAPIQFQRYLEELATLLSHVVPDGDLSGIVQHAVRKAVDDLRKRKGLPPLEQDIGSRDSAERSSTRRAPLTDPIVEARDEDAGRAGIGVDALRKDEPGSLRVLPVGENSHDVSTSKSDGFRRVHVPKKLRIQVMTRDGGRCQFPLKNGTACGSRWKCEIDHVVPVAKGGATTLENVRVLCRDHNLAAERSLFGDEFVDRRIRERSTPSGGHRGTVRPAASTDPPPSEGA